MKKTIVLSTLIGALMSANALANPATVNFEGNVVAPTCTLTADSITRTLVFNDVTTAQLATATANKIIPSTEMEVPVINFEKCPAGTTKIALSNVTSSGTHVPNSGYTPETGAGKGLQVGFVNPASGLTLMIAPGSSGWGGVMEWPVDTATGTASTANSTGALAGKMQLAVSRASAVTPVAGDYATTLTLEFSWL